MRSTWPSIRSLYDDLYEAVADAPSDLPFYRRKGDYRLALRLRFLETVDPPGGGDGPHLSWAHYPAVLPLGLGETDRGYYTRGALAEWRFRNQHGFFIAAEQREIFVIPPRRIKAFYAHLPKWWGLVEVPRGMAARQPQVALLRGSCLLAEPIGGPYNSSLLTTWVVEVADVLVSNTMLLTRTCRDEQ